MSPERQDQIAAVYIPKAKLAEQTDGCIVISDVLEDLEWRKLTVRKMRRPMGRNGRLFMGAPINRASNQYSPFFEPCIEACRCAVESMGLFATLWKQVDKAWERKVSIQTGAPFNQKQSETIRCIVRKVKCAPFFSKIRAVTP